MRVGIRVQTTAVLAPAAQQVALLHLARGHLPNASDAQQASTCLGVFATTALLGDTGPVQAPHLSESVFTVRRDTTLVLELAVVLYAVPAHTPLAVAAAALHALLATTAPVVTAVDARLALPGLIKTLVAPLDASPVLLALSKAAPLPRDVPCAQLVGMPLAARALAHPALLAPSREPRVKTAVALAAPARTPQALVIQAAPPCQLVVIKAVLELAVITHVREATTAHQGPRGTPLVLLERTVLKDPARLSRLRRVIIVVQALLVTPHALWVRIVREEPVLAQVVLPVPIKEALLQTVVTLVA